MMVPRAYRYKTPPSNTYTKYNDEGKSAVSGSERVSRKDEAAKSAIPPKMLTPQPQSTTKPVVIPTRTRNRDRRNSSGSTSRDKIQDNARSPHDSSSTPSSVAALLAMTSLPEPRYYSRIKRGRKGWTQAGSAKQDKRQQGEPSGRALSSFSPQSWDLLLCPPEEADAESCSLDSDTTPGPLSSIRSMSSESMPSLATDSESLNSVGEPASPELAIVSRSEGDRRQKSISTSKGEDCVLDHPLLPNTSSTDIEAHSREGFMGELSPERTPIARSRSSFKSNLTASFRKIRSAAQSFSTFTAPAVPPEDCLSRPLLSTSSRFTDERRPLPSDDTPDPALRRYLNPITISPSELYHHLQEECFLTSQSNCKASVQLQPYSRKKVDSEKASSPPIFASQQQALDVADGVPHVSLARQREPRENSDFLRVIVLEMNMRKVGKLSDASPGRAKLWLPARETGKKVMEERGAKGEMKKGIPRRWTGISVEA